MPKKILLQESGCLEVASKILESWKGYKAVQVIGGGFSCCCCHNHWRIVGSSLEPMFSLLCLQFFFQWPFVFNSWAHSLCYVLSLWRHLSFNRERFGVAFFKKQLKDEHNERNAELKVLRKHGRSAERILHASFSSLKYHSSLTPMGCFSRAKEYTPHISPVFVF